LDAERMRWDSPQMQKEAKAFCGERPFRWRNDRIGASLEDVRARLCSLAAKLQEHVDEPTAPLLHEARRQLEQACCRIGVIGQVKAGKSTFINALVEQPGLLPSNINPSTAVVTLLNFRRSEAVPEHAAVFRLFSPDEWQDLAEGGGNLRKLTERLVPGFRPELLRAQLEFMRKRAERRLGPDFHELLGQSHCFKQTTQELLSDYISAGSDYEATSTSERRRLSDITRTAELFFSDGPFAFPVTLIDTPGNNDAFLVRDEVTRRTLDSPDIFIFVLSALQPLSAADLSMLRLLNGLHKDRIIVFVNRTDLLTDPLRDGLTVKCAVERRLRLEFPALDIPVIAGSSWWGNLSLLAELTDVRAHLKRSELIALGGPNPSGSEDPLAAISQLHLSQALHENSAMPQVAAAVTRMMGSSDTAVLLRQIAACFLEIARSTEILTKAELKSLEKHQEVRQLEAKTVGSKIAEEQQSLRLAEERTTALQATFKQIDVHFSELIATGTEALRNDLGQIVHEFSNEQAELVLLSQGHRRNKVDVMPLRGRLEVACLASCGQMASDLGLIEGFLYPQLQIIVGNLLSHSPAGYLEPPTAPLQPLPSAPLSVAVALDLGEPWWRLWFATRPSSQQQTDHLRKLIENEFTPVIEELVRLAQIRLTERVDYTVQRLNTIVDGMLTGIERRKVLLAAEYSLLTGDGDDRSSTKLEIELAEHVHACRETCAACTLFAEELTQISEMLETSTAQIHCLQQTMELAGT
jgi:signal recognition particle receptor subunit beta